MVFQFQKTYFQIIAFLFLPILICAQNSPEHDAILSVERIWDRAAHNAFTSLIDFNGTLYVDHLESMDKLFKVIREEPPSL